LLQYIHETCKRMKVSGLDYKLLLNKLDNFTEVQCFKLILWDIVAFF